MGSGSSTKSNSSSSSEMNLILGSRGRGQKQFTEVELEHPNSPVRTEQQPDMNPGQSEQSNVQSTHQAETTTQLLATPGQPLEEDAIMFEMFHHNDGQSYTCITQLGQRHYLDDWNTHNWQVFPSEWINNGHFTIDGEPIHDAAPVSNNAAATPSDTDTFPGVGRGHNDREGTIIHPTRGRLLTYIFEEKCNVHCYFDETSGSWVKMPVTWEQHTGFVQPLVAQVQEALPTWTNTHDVIATLRQTNYDPQEAVSTYMTIGDTTGSADSQATSRSDHALINQKEHEISALQNTLSKVQTVNKTVTNKNKRLNTNIDKLQQELDELRKQTVSLEVEAKTANLRLAAMLERPRTVCEVTKELKAGTPEIETAEIDSDSSFDSSPRHVPSPPPPHVMDQPNNPSIDTDLLVRVNNAVKELDKSILTLKLVIKQGFDDIQGLVLSAIVGLSKMQTMESNVSQEVDNLRVLYKKECLQRKLLHNQLQELRGNIRVFCRVRYDSQANCCLEFTDDQEIHATNAAGKKMVFSFDKVFTPTSTQVAVFKEVSPIITSCVDGYNVCIMAYGQTGSGKTYTMMGASDDPGVNIRSIKEVLNVCKERDQVTYTLTVSMLEVYNESLIDLLSDGNKKLDIKMQCKRLMVQGLTQVDVCQESDITAVMAMGDANRTTAATKVNSTSSRSHLLLILNVEGVNKVSNAASHGSLMLIDLAGSERIAKTGATGQTLVEAAAINKSLTALGQVFNGLRTNALHIPYRNSKLTHLVQQALGGDAKACLFVNTSPDVRNIGETLCALQFGSDARQVSLGQATRNIIRGAKK